MTRSTLSLAPLAALAAVLTGCGPSLYNVARGRAEWGCIGAIWVILAVFALLDLLKSKRDTTSKLLWGLVIVAVPAGLGAVLYHFFGKKG